MPTLADSHAPPPKSWKEFEDIVLSAARIRWRSPKFQHHGRQGQQQNGVDIYGHDDRGQLIGIQCKNTFKRLTTSLINAEIQKASAFTPAIAELVIATTAERDVFLQESARDITLMRRQRGLFGISLYFWDDIWLDLAVDPKTVFKHFPHIENAAKALATLPTNKPTWLWSSVFGTQFDLLSGTAGTASAPNGFPLATFPASSTVVLGAATTKLMETATETCATWKVPLPAFDRQLFERGYLIIAAIRYFAGLHSKFYDSKAQLQLNATFVDHISLRDKPERHSHYFHSLPRQDLPCPPQLAACQNIYWWPLLQEALVTSEDQSLKVTIGNYVRWDIDYLGFLIKLRDD